MEGVTLVPPIEFDTTTENYVGWFKIAKLDSLMEVKYAKEFYRIDGDYVVARVEAHQWEILEGLAEKRKIRWADEIKEILKLERLIKVIDQ